ncbi:MAG: RsmE family RNA methyltransferase [Kiritimatiellales bacterium]|jgi:RsmE family RNA methyltransferase
MNLIIIHPHEPDNEGRVHLSGVRAAHIQSVLRAVPGKELRIGLLNGPLGRGTVAEIHGKEVVLRCEFSGEIPSRPAIDLLLALPRPKVMKRLWAQLAALGVGRIILTNAEKVERYYFDSHVLDPDFYTGLLIDGLQQAGDTRLPKVQVVRELKPFLEDELDGIFPQAGTRLLADPSGARNIFQTLEKAGTANRLLAVGSEGGWTPYELEMFSARGFRIFNAGPRILRTDTACIALLSLLTLCSGTNEK